MLKRRRYHSCESEFRVNKRHIWQHVLETDATNMLTNRHREPGWGMKPEVTNVEVSALFRARTLVKNLVTIKSQKKLRLALAIGTIAGMMAVGVAGTVATSGASTAASTPT